MLIQEDVRWISAKYKDYFVFVFGQPEQREAMFFLPTAAILEAEEKEGQGYGP